MSKEELFKKYSIDETHNVWENTIDNWMGVEVYRIMHEGKLPPQNDISILWVCAFLDKIDEDMGFVTKLMGRKEDDFGSLYLTSKRMVYRHAAQILKGEPQCSICGDTAPNCTEC